MPPPKECPDHSEQIDVTSTYAFLLERDFRVQCHEIHQAGADQHPRCRIARGRVAGDDAPDQAERNARQGDRMRNDLVIQIHKGDHDEATDEDEQENRSEVEPETKYGQQEERTGQGLDERIPPGNPTPATTTPAPEQQEAQKRDIVMPPDGDSADRAARRRTHDTLSLGQAMDTDVQETPDDQPYKGTDDPFLYAHDATGPGPGPP